MLRQAVRMPIKGGYSIYVPQASRGHRPLVLFRYRPNNKLFCSERSLALAQITIMKHHRWLLSNRNLFLSVLGAEKSKINGPTR